MASDSARRVTGGLFVRPVAAAVLGALLTLCLAGCSRLQATADKETVGIADFAVPMALTDAVAAATTPEQRAVLASEWLSDPYSTLPDGYGPTSWALRGRDGTTFRVDVYHWWESGDLLPPDQGEAVWGLACRTYDVAAPTVVTTTVECPEDTPTAP